MQPLPRSELLLDTALAWHVDTDFHTASILSNSQIGCTGIQRRFTIAGNSSATRRIRKCLDIEFEFVGSSVAITGRLYGLHDATRIATAEVVIAQIRIIISFRCHLIAIDRRGCNMWFETGFAFDQIGMEIGARFQTITSRGAEFTLHTDAEEHDTFAIDETAAHTGQFVIAELTGISQRRYIGRRGPSVCRLSNAP